MYAELLRRLRRGREGPARNLYHLKVVEYERQRRCRGGAAPPEDNGEEEEEEEGPDHAHRPSPTWQEPNPEELQESRGGAGAEEWLHFVNGPVGTQGRG